MRIHEALSDFLYDQKYFITIFDNKIHVYRYYELKRLTNEQIVLNLSDFDLYIEGENLQINQMNNEEILIEGNILKVRKEYD